MKKLCISIFLILICSGCNVNQGDFGAKFCAVYNNYDSAAFHLKEHISKQKDVPAYYWMFLGVSEMYRGNIPEMHEAFEKAEKSRTYPELLIVRCNWHMECGNIQEAEEDLLHLKNILQNRDFSKNYNYYRFLIVLKQLQLPHDHTWQEIKNNSKYQQLLIQSEKFLQKKLATLKKSRGNGLPVLRNFSDPEISKITLGTTFSELCKLLGKPCKTVFTGGMQKQRIVIFAVENHLIGCFFTEKSQKTGEIKVTPACAEHSYAHMRLLKRGKCAFGKLQPPFHDDIFCYTAEYSKPTDFNWICLECKKK